MAFSVIDEFDFDKRLRAGGAAPSAVGAVPTPAAAVTDPAAARAARMAGFGAKAADWFQGWGGKLLKPLPGIGTFLQGATGSDSTPIANSIRMGVGAGALLHPAVGVPLATGMGAADLAIGAASGPILRAADTSPLAPAFQQQVDAAGGYGAYTKAAEARTTAPVQTAPAADFSLTKGSIDRPTGMDEDDLNQFAGPPLTGKKIATEPAPARYQSTTAFGGMFGALAKVKVLSNDQSAARADTKLYTDYLLKGAEASKHQAEAAAVQARVAAADRIRAAGGSDADVAAATAGRSQGAVYTGIPDISGKNVDVVQTRGPGAGSVVRKPALPPITPAAIAQAAAHPDSIKAAKAAGITPEEYVKARLKSEGRL